MSTSSEKFARLLTEAVYRIRTLEDKSVSIVQDELGYAIGKKGGASIEHWRKGNVPSRQSDIENLARALVVRGNLSEEWLEQFLESASFSAVARLRHELFPRLEAVAPGYAPPPPPPAVNGSQPAPAAPSSPASDVYHNNLPAQLTAFIGRDKELGEIVEYLADPHCQLVTLTGPGGIGKTRLALQSAQTILDEHPQLFAQGVCFVSLVSLSTADFLVSTIANALNFSFFSGEDLQEQLLSYLRQKQILLIIDNLEHLLDETALLVNILHQAPGVKIMATSRERLNLRGEWVIKLYGLNYPRSARNGTITNRGEIVDESGVPDEEFGAVHLFIQNARKASSDFEPRPADWGDIIGICQLVEGIPLAIELAASWVRVLSCQEIRHEITQNYDFLATTWRDIPERHRSLQAVFDYSWNLLSPQEQKSIRQLSVFRNGFLRDAASQVAGASLMTLTSLMDKSFLHRQTPTAGRYEMHDLLRQYAQEKLGLDPQEEQSTFDAHCTYYANFLFQRTDSLKGGRQIEALEEIGEEIANIRAGWRWAIIRNREDALEMYEEALYYFYDFRSWLHEGEEAFRSALENLRRQPQVTERTLKLMGRFLARQGRFCHQLAMYTRAEELTRQALEIFKQYTMPQELAFVHKNLGSIYHHLGDYDRAELHAQLCLELCQDYGYNWGIAKALQTLGNIAEVQGNYKEAKDYHTHALEFSRSIEDLLGTAASLNRLGYLHWRLGEYEPSRLYGLESLELYQKVSDRRGIAMSYKNLGNIACDHREFEEAQQYYLRGKAICEEIGDQWGLGAFLNNLGYVAWEMGDYVSAQILCEQSIEILRHIKYLFGLASTLETLANIAIALQDFERSKTRFRESLQIALDIHARPMVLDAMIGMSYLMAHHGNPSQAAAILHFIIQQPLTNQESRDKAKRRLAEIQEQFGEAAVPPAEPQPEFSLEGLAQEFLAGS